MYDINICINPRLWREACYLQPPYQPCKSIIICSQCSFCWRNTDPIAVCQLPLHFYSFLSLVAEGCDSSLCSQSPSGSQLSVIYSLISLSRSSLGLAPCGREVRGQLAPLSQQEPGQVTHQANTHTDAETAQTAAAPAPLQGPSQITNTHTHALICTGPKTQVVQGKHKH